MAIKNKRLNRKEIDEIIDLYKIENWSSQKIADKFNRSRAGIINLLKRENIKINKRGAQEGHITSEETKRKIGLKNKEKKYTLEERKEMSKRKREGENPKIFLLQGYLCYKSLGKAIKIHREVWEQTHKRPIPNGFLIHHIDGNRLNNHPANLKLMSRSEHSKLHCEQGDFAIGVKNFNSQ
jgi:predicted DNA-binding protein YlxM (UPF0122 family)